MPYEYKSNLLALLVAKRQNIPWPFRRPTAGQDIRCARNGSTTPVDRFLLRYFPRVVSVSSEITRHLVGRGVPADRITTISNAIDPDHFQPSNDDRTQIRSSMGIDDDDFVIGTVGRLEPQKRFDILIEAFARFLPTSPKSVLLIAGDGSLRKRLEAQISRLDLGQRCRLLGHVSDVRRLYECMDLFVQSSDYEGTPNVVLEAMAMKVPVIATDAGGNSRPRDRRQRRAHYSLPQPHCHGRGDESREKKTKRIAENGRTPPETRSKTGFPLGRGIATIEELYIQLLKEFTFHA